MQRDENVQTLVDLDLTVLQAKVYFTLAQIGRSVTGRIIAKAAKVASQDIYRVLSELHEKGLVEKIISRPHKYKSIPLEEGLSMLLKRRMQQTVDLQKTADKICQNFQKLNKEINENDNYVLIPGPEPAIRAANNFIQEAQTSLDEICLLDISVMYRAIFHKFDDKELSEGVKIRKIQTYCRKDISMPKSFLKSLKRNPALSVRFLQFEVSGLLTIRDKKEVIIIRTNAKRDEPLLYTNNPVLVEIIQQWYDNLWEKSSEEYPKA